MRARNAIRALAFAAISAACSSGSAPPASFSNHAFLTSTSASGDLRVELRTSPQPPARGLIQAQLVVTRIADGTAVDGLTLAVRPWMPAMNHGAPAPAVVPQGDGTYLISDVDLYMAGRWQLQTTVSGPMQDHVVPDFTIE